MDLYLPDGEGGWARSRAGDSVLPRDSVPHRTHVLRVALPPGNEHLLYVRVASQGPVSPPLRLWQRDALWASDQKTYSVLSLYFGLLLGLLAYNFLLYLSLRDRAFLLYVAFVASLGMAQRALTGMGMRLYWGQWLWWTNAAPNVGN